MYIKTLFCTYIREKYGIQEMQVVDMNTYMSRTVTCYCSYYVNIFLQIFLKVIYM